MLANFSQSRRQSIKITVFNISLLVLYFLSISRFLHSSSSAGKLSSITRGLSSAPIPFKTVSNLLKRVLLSRYLSSYKPNIIAHRKIRFQISIARVGFVADRYRTVLQNRMLLAGYHDKPAELESG